MAKKKIGQIILAMAVIFFLFSVSEAKERWVEVTFNINLKAPENSKNVRL